MSFRLIPVLASGAFLMSSAAAVAQSATATADVNVRSGPGTQYAVIDQLPAGEPVRIIDCRGDWCEISMGGDSGFVARGYLDDGGRRSSARVTDDRDDYGPEQVVIEPYDPDATAGLSIGGYYESRPFYIREGYYYWGGRWYGRRPGAPGWRNGSWRRFEERRGPGTIRDGRTNKPPRVDDRRARIDRGDDGRDRRFQPMERRGPDAPMGERGGGRANVDRGGGRESREPRASEPGRGGGDLGGRSERPEARGGGLGGTGGGRGPDGGGRTPGGGSNDRGDRVGLDRAGSGGGGGGRNDR